MKLQYKITTTALALAGLALIPAKAQAATGAVGDLILGFQDTNGNVTNDLEVDLGAASQYTTTASFTLTAGSISGGVTGTGGLNAADLNTAFGTTGTGWNLLTSTGNGTNVEWAIFGAGTNTTNANAMVWMTQPQGGAQTGVSVENQLNSAAVPLHPTETGLTFGSGSAAGTTSGIQNSANATSYTQEGYSNGNDWNLWTTSTQQNVSSSGNMSIDLYLYQGTSLSPRLTDLGTFTLTPTGGLTYNGTAVPEPTTFGLLGMAAVGMVGLRRRRSVA